jgi:predicted dehydrogenase
MEEFLRLAAVGSVQLSPLVTHTFPLEDARKAYQTIFDSNSNSLAVLLKYPAASSTEPLVDFQPRHQVELRARKKTEGTLGVAVAGAGNLARWVHLPNLKKIGGVHLRAVHSSSGPRGKSYAKRFGVDYCSSDYQEMLRDPSIDVVVITSRNPQHAPQTLAALQAGKHVFVEKPMALTEEECRTLNRAVEETGKQIAVGFNRRFAPSYVQLKKQLVRRTGPAVLNCRINSPGISGSYWMADPASGGAVIGEACHFADLMYWLLGAEPVAVSAFSLPVGKKDPIGENNLVASFRFADGSIGNLTYCTVGSRTSAGEFVEVFAPGLGASAEDFKRVAIKSTTVRKQSSWFAEKGYATQLQSFVESFRAGTPPVVAVRDGARATIACVRMLESARHQVVTAIDLDAVLGCR